MGCSWGGSVGCCSPEDYCRGLRGGHGTTPVYEVDKVRCGASSAAVLAVSVLSPARRPRPAPPETGAGAVARRRTRTGRAVVSGPSAVTAADDASSLFRKSRR